MRYEYHFFVVINRIERDDLGSKSASKCTASLNRR